MDTNDLPDEQPATLSANSPVDLLTEREVEVLRLVAQGCTNQDIADGLEISVRTVGTHVSHMMNKLGLRNRTQLALFALREGVAPLFPE